MRSIWVNVVVGATLCLLSGMLLAQQPDGFESLLASAQQAQARSDFESAANFYQEAAKIHPEIPEIRTNLGLMYYQTGKNDLAAEEFRAAIRLKPSLFVPNLFLGLTDMRLKRYDDAIPHLKRAATAKPSEVQAQLGLGAAYSELGKSRLAIAAYLRGTQIDSGNADTWYRLGVTYLEQVEADARILLTRHKDSAYLQVLMADNFSERHAWIQADDAYKKALASAGVPADTHASYAFVLLNRHDFDRAERELKAELASHPSSLLAKLGLARLHLEQGQTARSADELEEIFNTDAGFLQSNVERLKTGLSPDQNSELQKILDERQTSRQASAEVARIIKAESAGTPEADANGKPGHCNFPSRRIDQLQANELKLLAPCAYESGQYKLAFDTAGKLIATPANEAEGLYWETKSAQRLATETLAHASEMDSASPKLHVLLGDVYRQQKSFPDAEQEYRKALAIQPDDTGALFGLSLALLADDQADEALSLAETALQKKPEDPELNAVMGEILCARNDFSGAEPYLKKSLNTKPEYVPHVHALLGKVYSRTGRTEQAISELKLALAQDKDGTVHYQIARLYLKVGDRQSAKQAFDVSQRLRSEGLNRAAVAMQQGEDDSGPE